MASSSTLKRMEESFFLCSVCLDQFKEPKLLPCLHRYCRDCLKKVIQTGLHNKIQCPLCKEHCAIPKDGVDGFKTDFHMKSMLEFIQSQNSPDSKETHLEKCFSCSKTVTSLACCITCENVPVCEACTNTTHQGHDMHDVTELSKSERESLTTILANLENHRSHLHDLRERVTAQQRELRDTAAMKREKLQYHFHEQVKHTEDDIDKNNVSRERELADVESGRHTAKYQLDTQMEEEINLVRMNYEKLKKTTDENYDGLSIKINLKYDNIGVALCKTLTSLDSNLLHVTTAIDALTKQKENELTKISDHCDQVYKRYENFTATSSSIFASNDAWTDVQRIPDITSAIGSLMEDMKVEFPDQDLADLSGLSLSDILTPAVTIGDVTAKVRYDKSVVNIKGITARGWSITGMAGNRDGNITITGRVSENASHITVINRHGDIQQQDQINKRSQSLLSSLFSLHRYCCSLSEFKVASVCKSDDIGIYDTRYGTYNSKNVSDAIGSWPVGRSVTCVSTDPVNNHIIVGTDSRDVYFFDDQLNYSHTMTLPTVIGEVIDLAVHGDSLLVCDAIGNRSHVVTMKEPESILKYELPKLVIGGGTWRPISVCTDKKGFIYMLWKSVASGKSRCLLVEYSQDGRQLLTGTSVDGDARSVATLEADEDDKLLISTYKSGHLYIADLVETNT